jgi:hypothetical protein
MCRRVGKKDKERRVCLDLSLHKVDRLVGQVAIDERAIVQPVGTLSLRCFAPARFHHTGFFDTAICETRQPKGTTVKLMPAGIESPFSQFSIRFASKQMVDPFSQPHSRCFIM